MSQAKKTLVLITPCARPENLERIAQVLGTEGLTRYFDAEWIIVRDAFAPQGIPENLLSPDAFGQETWPRVTVLYERSQPADRAGHRQANAALRWITGNPWVWRLDDDNLPVTGFFRELATLHTEQPMIDLWLLGQVATGRYDESRWTTGVAFPEPEVGVIDSAQIVFRRQAAASYEFPPQDYRGDGEFIKLVWNLTPSLFRARDDRPLTQYNALAREGALDPPIYSEGCALPHFYERIEGFFHCAPLYRRMVAELPDGAQLVEVGVWKGRSAAFMGVEIANSGKRMRLHAIDAFTTTPDGSGAVNEARLAEVVQTLAPVADWVRVRCAQSLLAAWDFPDASLDFVFLDADHEYAAVKADIRAWLPKVKPGGVLAGDDYCYPGIEGVKRAVDELLPGAFVPARFEDGVSGWWEYRVPKPLELGAGEVQFSIISPLHQPGNAFIGETWASLLAQTETRWEWLVLENHGGRLPEAIRQDPRVRALQTTVEGVGALKRMLCQAARAPIVVELDSDDVLAPNALEAIGKALAEADFAFSDFAEFQHGTYTPGVPFLASCGWKTYAVEFRGHELLAHEAPPATPQNVRLVDWAPNHVRAWRAAAYWDVGGHNPNFSVGDDHDLVCRFMVNGKRFAHIAQCLYFYRLHAQNTVRQQNAAIRRQTQENYERYCWQLAEMSGNVWSGRNTSCKAVMRPGEWLFLLCPRADWYDRRKIPLLKGDFHVAMLYDRGFEVEAHLIRLGPGYEPYGLPCGDDVDHH